MKRSDQFLTFQRQSPRVVVIAIVKYFQGVVRQVLWPLIILWFFGKGTDTFTQVIIGVSIFTGLFSIVTSVIRYTHFYYCLNKGKLRVKKGLLTTRNITVPIEKVQRVEFEENIFHRLMRVVTVRIETAGAEEEEVEIGALPKDRAEDLRMALLEGREGKVASEEGSRVDLPPSAEVFRLSFFDLLRAGLLQNHLQTLGLIVGFFAGLYFQFQEVLDLDKTLAKYLPSWYYSNEMMTGFIYLVPVILIVVVILTLIRTVIQYFDFRMWRKAEGYQVAFGIFNRRTYSSLDRKVQYVHWKSNVLMRLIGMYSMSIFQAGSVALRRSQSIRVPFCFGPQVNMVLGDIYPYFEAGGKALLRPSMSYLGLVWSRYGLLPAVLFTGIGYFRGLFIPFVVLSVIWMIIILIWGYYYTRSMFIEYDDEYLTIKKGVLAQQHWLLQYTKLQGLSISANPVEGYRNLASISLFSAAGTIRFPYLPREEAVRMADYLLYRIERARRPWM
jgi:putative membrane protein